MPFLTRRAFAALVLAMTASRAVRADADPAAAVASFDDALLDVMKNAKSLGFKGRYDRFAGILDKSFDLPLMTRIAVGPGWAKLGPEEQAKLIDVFSRLSITTYARRFDGYSGERFELGATTPSSGGDQVVATLLVRATGEPVPLNYRMRLTGPDWRIIDVYLNGTISQIAVNRAEFQAILRGDGADGLIDLIERKIAELTPATG